MGVGRPKFDFHTAVHHKYGADRHLALPHGGVGEVQRPLHPPIVLGRVVVLARIVGVGGFHLCAAALRVYVLLCAAVCCCCWQPRCALLSRAAVAAAVAVVCSHE